MSFQIKALEPKQFAATPEESATVRCLEATTNPGFPCRVSLEDAKLGERVLALHYLHHDVDSPYRASGPIFVRALALQGKGRSLQRDEVPDFLRHRQLSIRGFDAKTMMVYAIAGSGAGLEKLIAAAFDNSEVDYLHIHNAAPGCFMCKVER